MDGVILFAVIVLPVLGVGYAVLRWAIRKEHEAVVRANMERVYYLRPRMRDDAPEWKRVESE